jgi:hypothetical protein
MERLIMQFSPTPFVYNIQNFRNNSEWEKAREPNPPKKRKKKKKKKKKKEKRRRSGGS